MSTPGGGSRARDVLDPLPPVPADAPLLSFDSVTEYERRHREGTDMEFEFEKREIKSFNAALLQFRAFPMISIRRGKDSKDILLFVEPRERDQMLPREDERCTVEVPGAGTLDAMRKENPCSSWGVRTHHWDKHLVFEITLPNRFRGSIIPYFSGPEMIKNNMEMPQPHRIQAKNVTFELRLSYSTMLAERGALDIMIGAVTDPDPRMQRKAIALKYIMEFGAIAIYEDLFRFFPYMKSPASLPRNISPQLGQMMRDLDSHQKHAYKSLLSHIPAGVGILPGGPGAGKTRFISVVVAALQSTDEIILPGEATLSPHRNTCLLLCDINKPATDIANKLHRMYRDLRLTRYDPISGQNVPRVAVRMYCWSYEKKSLRRARLEAEDDDLLRRLNRGDRNPLSGANGFAGGPATANYDPAADTSERVDVHRFSLPFLRAGTSSADRTASLQQEHVAPTLDQFARADYERNKNTEYSRLRGMLSFIDIENFDSNTIVPYVVEREIEKVYKNALRKIDFLATTPVTASKFSGAVANIYNPVLVFFDEASHAREASTLIAIAKFNPRAWIFTGDPRQTKPWVGSYGNLPNINKYARQLRTSMMERASRLNPGGHALMINHRACGNLHQLPSRLFYNNRMVSAYGDQPAGWMPPSAQHLRRFYIMKMKRDNGPPVSRLLVVLDGIGAPSKLQESWYHPAHQRWVKNLVSKLLQDRDFKQTKRAERGTILIMAPYRAALAEYRKVIKELRTGSPRLNTSTVEARTVDTAQGHEANVLILDLVRDRVTDHLADSHRLCVATTRAIQAEVILMHEDMLRQLRHSRIFGSGTLAEIVRHCEQAGELVVGPASI